MSRVLILGGSSQLTPLLLQGLGPDTAVTVTTTSAARLHDWPNVIELVHARDAPGSLRERVDGEWDAVISLVPITALPRLLPVLEAARIGRFVALSTASVVTKAESRSAAEHEFLHGVRAGEQAFHAFLEKAGIAGVLLRPAMTYGGGDNNVGFIRRMGRRFGFFPVVNRSGMRQPVHVDDVVQAVLSALRSPQAPGNTYFLGGGERLTFEEMARRILRAELGHERVLRVPGWLLSLALRTLSMLPGFAYLDPDMARRMREDHVFDIEPARRDLGFSPRGFLRGRDG